MTAIDNLVFQTTTTTGTGNITLDAATRRQTFNEAFGTGGTDVFYYFIDHQSLQEWEVGTGHLSTSTTLVRDTVLASSNSGSAVNFSAGTKDVACDLPSSLVPHTLLTTRGDVLVRGASDPQRLAVGTAGQVLGSDGTDPEWTNVGWEIITSGAVSAAASLDITDLTTAYRAYKLVFDEYVPATDATDLWVRTDTNNGASFESGASDYQWSVFGTQGIDVTATADAADSEIEINVVAGSGFGNAAGECSSGEITVFNPMDSGQRTQVSCFVILNNANTAEQMSILIGAGERRADEANNAFQILSSSGNITSMNYTLYGLRAS